MYANASRKAATIPGANHLTAEGRKLLFTQEYPLAWGEAKVTPDAFVTGVAVLSADLRTLTVGTAAFDRSSQELIPLGKFDVTPDVEDLIDSGESFSVRGVFDQASLKLTADDRKQKASDEALLTSLEVKSETVSQTKASDSKLHPLSPSNLAAPVALEIRYDDEPRLIEFRGGAAFVPEPREAKRFRLWCAAKEAIARVWAWY